MIYFSNTKTGSREVLFYLRVIAPLRLFISANFSNSDKPHGIRLSCQLQVL